MKSCLFSILFLCCLLASAQTDNLPQADADTLWSERYVKAVKRRGEIHQRMRPNQTSLQFAGSIGFLSAAFGWHYGKKEAWETELFFGFVPKYNSNEAKFTLTLKQRYTPWHIPLKKGWEIDPLMCSFSLGAIFGEDFWTHEPSRYPNGYYGFSNRFRFHLSLGQRLRYNISGRKRWYHKSVALYYELGTNELYIISSVPNRHLPFRKTLSLAIGATLEF